MMSHPRRSVIVLTAVVLTTVATLVAGGFSLGSTAQADSFVNAPACSASAVTGQINGNDTATIMSHQVVPCTVGFASYEMYRNIGDLHWIDDQKLYDVTYTTLQPGQTVTLSVSKPSCRYQIDLFVGSVQTPPEYGGKLIDADFGHRDRALCGQAPTPTPSPSWTPTPTPSHTPTPTPSHTPTPTPSTLVHCAPAAQNITVNTTAHFTASGGSGIYLWDAPDALPDGWYGNDFQPIYTTTGAHSVTVTSPGSSNTATCAVYVQAATPTPTPSWTPTPTPTPYNNPVSCFPSYQEVTRGQTATLSVSGGTGSYTWSAANGDPSYGYAQSFSTRYWDYSQYGQTHVVTVQSGSYSAGCLVRVLESYTPTPTPYTNLYCTPSYQTVANGQYVTFSAHGGTGSYTWSAANGDPSYGYAQSFSTRYWDGNQYGTSHTLTVTSGNQTANCTVQVQGNSIVTPTPTPYTNQYLSITKYGKNISRGQTIEQSSVAASANQTIEFDIHVRSLTTWDLTNVTVQDALPAGVAYLPGTTSVGGTTVADGVTGGGINVGTLAANQEIVVKLYATVTASGVFPNGSTTAYNTAYAHADNANTVSAQLPISMGEVLGVATVQTGTGSSILIALLLSGVVTFGYLRYTGTDLFRRRDARAIIRRSTSDHSRLNFARFL